MPQLSRLNALDADMALAVMSEEKKPEQYDLTISGEKLRKRGEDNRPLQGGLSETCDMISCPVPVPSPERREERRVMVL
ncbi:MAG: hypothetical protein IJQ81_00115 [Oscillibacter sp.]|nr:hypothetical protein [Oscillibacter sp.]